MSIRTMKEQLDALGQKLGEKSRLPKKETTPEQLEALNKYWSNVLDSPRVEIQTPPIQIARNWYRILRREVRSGATVKKGQKPRFDGHIEKLYRAVLACALGCDDLGSKIGIDSSKGLCVIGAIGIAKSSVFRHCVSKPFFKARMVTCNTIKMQASKKGFEALEKYEQDCWVLDDLGVEGVALHFGQKIYPIQELAYTRYDLFMRHGIKTYFTTNKTADELAELYDARFLNRLNDMCNIIELSETVSLRG